jgi:S1-C subfamily serine protease
MPNMNKLSVALAAALALTAGATYASEESMAQDVEAGLEAKLEAARERLEAAASEVAELSAEIGRPVMDRFMAFGGGPRRAILGVQLDPGGGNDGARIREVSPGGPAAEAGIQPRDVIVMMNGTDVKGDSAREVVRIMRKVEPDSKVNVRVLRDGKPKDFIVIARPAAFAMFNPPVPPQPPRAPGAPRFDEDFELDMPFVRHFGRHFSDMELTALTPQLGRYFGTEEGILVVRAPEEEGLKLEDGDVILSIDGREPTSGSHATRILRSYQPGEKVSMRVMRQKKAMTVEVTLPEREGGRPSKRAIRTQEPRA